MKTIELPACEGGLYRFGELPDMIAAALHPDHDYLEDWIEWCAIWRDDGGDGSYWQAIAPLGERPTSLTDSEGWSLEPIDLSEDERENPAHSKWVNWRWHEQRRPADQQQRWPDGSLIVAQGWTQYQIDKAVSRMAQRTWHAKRLERAALRDEGDAARLCVLDGLGNELDFRAGAALSDGLVHLDELNRWGALQRPPRCFEVAVHEPFTAMSAPLESREIVLESQMRKLSAEQDAEIGRRFRQRQSVNAIAKHFNVSPRTVDRSLIRAKLKTNKP
ncbi:MAG: hypothetical protein EOO27_00905 [Comamonadaceae bacterium]|nr:MAG: hypothetical protein EOO27_00905 [Comamonadaceae bacterium]